VKKIGRVDRDGKGRVFSHLKRPTHPTPFFLQRPQFKEFRQNLGLVI
jgi:hypothetical protein